MKYPFAAHRFTVGCKSLLQPIELPTVGQPAVTCLCLISIISNGLKGLNGENVKIRGKSAKNKQNLEKQKHVLSAFLSCRSYGRLSCSSVCRSQISSRLVLIYCTSGFKLVLNNINTDSLVALRIKKFDQFFSLRSWSCSSSVCVQ